MQDMRKYNKTNVLVIGGGGREHALVWGISQSPLLGDLYISHEICGAPEVAQFIRIDCDNFLSVAFFCKQKRIDVVVVGPEKYLAGGLADALEPEGVLVFGPGKSGAQLESSKSFAKDMCRMNGVPTAKYGYFSDVKLAKDFVAERGVPIVIKADGLAAGKGVVICHTIDEANKAIDEILGGKFGSAGSTIIIEEFLTGVEVSFFALCDGETIVPFGCAKDYKSISCGGVSFNTGGMGSFSPIEVEGLDNVVMRKIIYPSVSSLANMGIKFRGVLFAGLMVTDDGPKLLEYNVRFGDPELQSMVVRLKSDLLSLIVKTAKGDLNGEVVRWHEDRCSVCVVMASKGYPVNYETGSVIKGLEKLKGLDAVEVFHAGSKLVDGKVIANAGRVLNIVAYDKTFGEARRKVYEAVKMVDWPDGFYIENVAENIDLV